jgi:hypothetical protein
MRCVGVVGSIVPGGMRAVFTISMCLLGVWPCAPLVAQTRLHTADPWRMPVMCRDRKVYAARVVARECAFHAVRSCGDQVHTKCTLHGGTPGGAVRRPLRCVRAR